MLNPPFRADQVGSLLRPRRAGEARAAFKRGELERAGAARTPKTAPSATRCSASRTIGLQGITDGEFRRDWWHLDFLAQLDGVTLQDNPGRSSRSPARASSRRSPPSPAGSAARGRSWRSTSPILKSVTTHGSTPKMTIPVAVDAAPARRARGDLDARPTPTSTQFWADVAAAYRTAIRHLADAGCRYLQLDDVTFAYLCDPKIQANCRANGDDPAALPRAYAEAINAALADRPADMHVTIHTCRGNFKSAWVAEGGYDPVVEAMFSTDVDGYFMEFDSARAGGFEPLRALPNGKKVVLGLVTTKLGELESKDDLKRRIDEAAQIRAAREPVPVAAMRLLQHPPRQRAVAGRAVAQAGAGGRGGARGVGRMSTMNKALAAEAAAPATAPRPPRAAATIVVVRDSAQGLEVLLSRRAERRRP